MRSILLTAIFLSQSVLADELPNSKVTPGKTNSSLTKEVICNESWSTKSVRYVPESVKKKVYAYYNVKNNEGYCSVSEGCEVDHLISLELGGSNDVENLWPQPYTGQWNAHQKDKLENKLHSLVCKGAVTLEQAQKDISTNWIDSYKKYGLDK